MAYIGCLGDIPFSVSTKTARTFTGMQWSGSARYTEHKRHADNALVEFTGLDADTISFDMVLSVVLGTNPVTELNRIWKYEREGTPLYLTLGEKGYGKHKWVIKSHKTDMERFDRNGNLIGAKVSISLLEYQKR